MKKNLNFQWVEKYRPQKLEDCVLPDRLKSVFDGIEKSKDKSFPNMIFVGSPGGGKTTLARVLCNVTDHEYQFINGSKDSGIDTLRTRIQTFATSVSFDKHRKCVIMDEADYANAVLQAALRGSTEQFAPNCAFIFTLNYKHRLIDAIQSRTAILDFTIKKEERPEVKRGIFLSIKKILEAEGVTFDTKVLVEHVNRYFPDFRRMINELQLYALGRGKIDVGILSQVESGSIELAEITEFVRTKNFSKIYEFSVQNPDPSIMNDLWRFWIDKKKIEGASAADLSLIVSEYEYRATYPVDPAVNICAFLAQVMNTCRFS